MMIQEANHFLYKFIPPRPTFDQDMTEAEGELMQRHIAYWTGLMGDGIAIAFGPVADPKGPYGLGIVEVKDESDVQALGTNDPAIKANAGFAFEVYSWSYLRAS